MNIQSGLTQRQKAAVIVRLLLDDEDVVSLATLNDELQTLLAEEMAGMEVVDRHTRDAVISEFCENLEAVGVTFPGNLDGTLEMLGSKLSEDSTDRLRRMAAMSGRGDPWMRISALPKESLEVLANGESVEMVALLLSKIPVQAASDLFSGLARERARAVAQAMSMTGEVGPDALRRVGLILLQAAENLPRPAIDTPATERVGAILNFATADLRDDVLGALGAEDMTFADGVRRAIFVYAHIPSRVATRDVARILREVDQPTLLRALAGADPEQKATSDFILANISQRMADGLREELAELGKVSIRDIEDAQNQVIAAIRALESAEELTLIKPADDDED
ncbi:flagellar motor switch protein FliG [Paracoccus sp. Z330]|uniref:Flagellar motor switch protein FliG n=1 Tax=Paracoccus onchidii TaxID=3017813 RepID=A0ABT4ZC89_9RHOB|nr:FliG C-terminal domain-containing protein [Paracoccus onchidii]MDB6176976.1 flagellar motor switch protein FliG [Paracoccus onchidii]